MEPQELNPSVSSLATGAQQFAAANPQSGSVAQTNIARGAASAPVVAVDNDLIENEWVSVMKQTMLRYSHDPYALSQAMTALREDYLMKRYGRRIETTAK